MEILPPSPPFLLILPPHPSLSLFSPPSFRLPPPLPSYLPLFSSLMSFFLSCVYPPWCLESSSFSVSIAVHSNLFSLPAECLFQPLTTFSPSLSISVLGSALPPCLLNRASNHFLSSLSSSFGLANSLFSSPFLSFSFKSLATPPLPAVSVSLTHFPLIPLSECASDGPFLSNPVHIDPYGSSMQGEGCEDHSYSVLNATNALDVGPETRLPGRALSIAAPSCQQQPNGLSIWDL